MKNLILCWGLLMSAVLTAHSQDVVKEYDLRPAQVVRTPLQGDSINQQGERFGAAQLLDTYVPFDFGQAARVQADTAGFVAVDASAEEYLLYLFTTRVRAERFWKGKLKVSSPSRFEVFVNGKSQRTKLTVQDSLAQVRPEEISLRLEPEADCQILVKLLAAPGDKAKPVLKCELEKETGFDGVVCHVSPDLKRRLSLFDTNFGSRVVSVSLSPDGKYLLTRYSDSYDRKRSRTHTELTELKTGRVILPNVGEQMSWMPRGSKLCYVVTGRERNDLWQYDPATGRNDLLCSNVPEGGFSWSPNGDYLIYTEVDKGEAVDGPLKRLLHPDDRIPGARDRYYLTKFDLKTGVTERLTYGSTSVYLNDISPDGSKLLCAAYKPVITKSPFTQVSLFEIDLATMEADTLVEWDASLSSGSYSPDGQQLLLLGGPDALGGVGRNCGNHPVANSFDVQAFLMERATREVKPITRDFNPAIISATWNRADGCIYFNTTDKDCQHIYRYTPARDAFELLPLEQDVISTFSLADDDASRMAYVGGGNTSSGVAYLYDRKKGKSVLLADPMREKREAIEWGEMKEWNFTSADGTLIEGMMCLPPSFDPQKKYPLIVYYYGGTTPTTRGFANPYSAQLFASRDYVVYVINPSGAIGYGQEFSARHVNAWGDWTADEIIEGTRKFCEAHPFVDPKRIGCLGASYGGFMTMYLQTKTDLFAAAASHAGISNVTSYWGEGYWGYSYNAVAAANSYPWSHPELFTRHGALFNAEKINTPLLLLHGTADTNVPTGESIQLYNALKILGKPVELITVDGENHFILDYDKRVQWHNSIMAWFARWLQDSPQWWNDLYPERHW